HLEGLGYQINDDEFEGLFEKFKALADKKAESSDMDIEALLADEVRSASDVYMLEYMKVCSGSDVTPEAKVRLRKNGDEVIEMTASGDGQVDAACKAIEMATGVKGKLISLNINAITEGLDAQGDVSIQIDVDGKAVLGRGVSTDIVEASAKAFLNAINKAISR
ncbi:MAG: 2-isopropylmalate synthase, partial [Rubrobacteridae bacterium]|nr:2-isopropylmalate synthase [Rubrobacteridae bacterium]